MNGLRVLLVALSVWAVSFGAEAGDRHAEYYYPKPQSNEIYKARAQKLPDASRESRLAFVTAVTVQQTQAPFPSVTAMFAKGAEAQKLILLGLQDGRLNTVYRARAVLAMLTATARTTPIFQQFQVETIFTFLDLLKMLGFTQVTVSDGREFAHQIKIE